MTFCKQLSEARSNHSQLFFKTGVIVFSPIININININSPVGKLLISINQSFTLLTDFSTELKKLIAIMI